MVTSVVLVLALGAGATLAAEEEPSVTGTFGPAGSLTEARSSHTATLLPDGRVLVVGGKDGDVVLSTAEVWDPATASFGPAGSLAGPRFFHTATLLPDNRVLVVGGGDGEGNFSGVGPAEVWDPATASFGPAGSLVEPRFYHTATLLPDGRVLIVGGMGDGEFLASAEVWDPATGTSGPAGTLAEARALHTATVLQDGRVLVVAGQGEIPDDGGFLNLLSSAEVWDPMTGTFGPAGSLAEPPFAHTATLLPDGSVLVLGGESVGDNFASAEVWDPATASFGPPGVFTGPRLYHTATLLPDGSVLIAGGAPTPFFAMAEVWDPETGTSGLAGTLAEARYYHTATLLQDGRVLVLGGVDGDFHILSSAEVWEPGDLAPASEATDTVSVGPELVTAVPLIEGLDTISASLALRDAGLGAASAVATSDVVPAGTVFDQSPAAGTLVDIGSAVSYSVSLGPAPVERVAVPLIEGLDTISASLALRDAGLGAASAVATSDVVPAGTVFDQSPAAGTLVDIGSAVSYSVSLGAAPVEVPVAGYWIDWADHKPLYRNRVRRAITSANRAVSKAVFYQRLVGIHNDELKWLRNHRPQACYADEYESWRRAVEDLHSIHKKTVRFLRGGNASGVRRAAKEQTKAIKRLDKALSNVADCGPSEPAVADGAPAGNPFVGVWETRIDGIAEKNGPRVKDRVTITIRKDGRFLQRSDRNAFCRTLGHGIVPLTVQGSGWFDLDASPRFHGSGRMHCYPRGRGRQLVGHPPMVFGHDETADVLTIERAGACYWRKGTGAPSDCEAFWRGVAVPVAPAGTFGPAGSLAEARILHTATLLPDGRVLVVGGRDADDALASAEVWDPATEAFGPAGSLAEARIQHTATLLPDGRVLVVGGGDFDGILSSAEVWDPATAAFGPAGSLADGRFGHTATPLPDGRILVVGGGSGGDLLASAEVWDPATASFGPARSLAEARSSHTATPLLDGRILVVGGRSGGDNLASAEVWEPSDG